MSYSAPPVGGGGQWRPPRQEIDFSVISESFTLLFANWKIYVVPGVVMFLLLAPVFLVSFAPIFLPDSALGSLDFVETFVVQTVLQLVASIVSVLLYAGIVKFTWNAVRGLGASTNDLWIGFKDPLGYLALGILVGLITSVGVLACCVGVLFAGGLTMFALPIKVVKGVTATEAISESWSLVKKDWLLAGVFYLLILILSQIGTIACYVGLMLTLNFMYIAPTVLYSRYFGMAQSPESVGPTSYPRGAAGYSHGIGEEKPPPP